MEKNNKTSLTSSRPLLPERRGVTNIQKFLAPPSWGRGWGEVKKERTKQILRLKVKKIYMNDFQPESYTVIVADGIFPHHEIPLGYLKNAERIICCDGSAQNLILAGMQPDAIVGDLDSLSDDLANRFADRIFLDESQDTNDLTKAVSWCSEMGYKDIVIVGATGKREDHTIGNISLLVEYTKRYECNYGN